VLRPPAQYRGRYQLRLADARGLIAAGCGPGPAPDSTPPALSVFGRRIQRPLGSGRIVVEVGCPREACVARASSRISLPGAARVFSVRSSARRIAGGERAKLVLRLGRRVRRSLRRKLERRRVLRQTVSVAARDEAGNAATARRVVELRR
jgi:hypothetical protein